MRILDSILNCFKRSFPSRSVSNKGPFVTVLMPCKDPHPGFFKEAVQSVIKQTSKDWHLIIIDDHSSKQETLDAFERIKGLEDKRIRIIGSNSKLITGALNTGMRHATTPFVCSLHCDDLLAPAAVEVLNSYITDNPSIDYFHSSRRHIDEDGVFIGDIKKSKDTITVENFRYGGAAKHLHCWKVRSALKIGGMDESLGPHGADDFDFPWCMVEAGFLFRAIPECLYYYRDHRGHYRLTTHIPLDKQKEELTKIFRKHGLSENEIQEQLDRRSAGYLKQALYLNDEDRKTKEASGFDPAKGWRESY